MLKICLERFVELRNEKKAFETLLSSFFILDTEKLIQTSYSLLTRLMFSLVAPINFCCTAVLSYI